ncbi:DNA polymerase III subunit gamma/tau [Fenollaria massiliensis]|uniref:DNA-directed DNA polymerase n=1 Tax=Fenollaria massiliensis TaxID=938288 RepID=A0A9E7DJ83_9FIRM|nr:DNA polymerase III subunit gamma/tau [Fenollaria massiliensis]UQK58948.1 DNA polymerase III subunit gamma/tau [Fenollaria massiliensis]
MSEALYRRFRPKTFNEIIGQDHITTILKNQILLSRLSHAYLFTGTRGTGKTSLAKVFARAINCLNPHDAEPCNECENCLEALGGKAVDIIELDAASNNSVDNIRELRDKAIYLPTKLKYKVYIIDEVHMLSKGAFNALLKILEEPPKHLIFILATTEPERIPKTIISRVQRFDFKRIDEDLIAKNLSRVLDIIGKKYEDDAVQIVARAGAGSMRDALSMLESTISYSDTLTKDSVLKALGLLDESYSTGIVEAIFTRNLEKYYLSLDKLFLDGKDEAMIIDGIIKALREILYDKVNKTHKYNFSFDIKLMDIINAIDIYMDYLERMKFVKEKRIFVEMAGLKVMSLDSDVMKMNFDRSVTVSDLAHPVNNNQVNGDGEATSSKTVQDTQDDAFDDLASLEMVMVDYEDEGFYFTETEEESKKEIKTKHKTESENHTEHREKTQFTETEKSEIETYFDEETQDEEETHETEATKNIIPDENEEKTIDLDEDEAPEEDFEKNKALYEKFLNDDEMKVLKSIFTDFEYSKTVSGVLVLKKSRDIALDTSVALVNMNKEAILKTINKYFNDIIDIKIESSDQEKKTLKLREDLKEFLGGKLIIK